jgi:hypothetical protein
MQLRIGGDDEPLLEMPLSPDREACCAVEQLQALPAQGVRLRTRALTTTMFARFLLGDLFLHGIGGAKYDELGDEIAGRFFGFTPPGYLTLSLTLWLGGLGAEPAARGRKAEIERLIRDLSWNPDRHLAPEALAEAGVWVERKQRALAVADPSGFETHAQRLERFHAIRLCNERLQPWVSDRREALVGERAEWLTRVHRDLLARNREYALVLHSRRRLREALERALPGLDLDRS